MRSDHIDNGYNSTAKALHWGMAALIVAEYCLIYSKHWFTEEDTAAASFLLQCHQTVGISLIFLVAWRIVLRLRIKPPAFQHDSRWMSVSAGAVHFALYFFMVAMPVSGYLYAKNPTLGFGAFAIPPFGESEAAQWLASNWNIDPKEAVRQPMRAFHREFGGEKAFWPLILLHAAAAIYHHVKGRSEVLLRMLPDRFRA